MTDKNYRKSCTAGVSESIGFLLIFTMVIVGIGLVTLYGYPMLLQQQVSADEQIMEKNMIVLQNDVKSLAYKTVPYKETSLKIGGGALTVYNSSYATPSSTIRIFNSSGDMVTSFRSGDLMYSSDSASTDISLQNGAVVKRPHVGGGSVMIAEPRWFNDPQTQTIVINLVVINSTDMMSRAGVGTVQMSLGETTFDIHSLPAGDPVTLEYTPDPIQDYSTAWDSYFQKIGMIPDLSNAPGTGAMLTYDIPPSYTTLVIKKYEVNIRSL